MTDWKGRKAHIVVREKISYGSRPVCQKTVLLDTDTLNDLFEEFDPSEHHFTICPEQAED